ncbi:hypothetical protein MAM1_0051c03393 [Mucor ambiguus]|uniref:Uncharacterized protein n=1 Tax=Mucor ambiguus TaxID=91626 RepID=A0A0C9MLD4_9FUNG|nr:hypothetical protein MAM1_0051c03393 [Mucor ambiguus]
MTTTFDSNDLILNDPQQQQYALPHFTVDEYESELNYFYDYDQDMAEVVNEAEYQDYCYQQQQQQEDQEQQEEEADIMDDSLLKLIVDVQSYLSEAPTDSPLFALQYKMYTYLKQRAFEMGMEIPPSF